METLLEREPVIEQAQQRRYTFADYKALDVDDDFFYELINGELVKKSAPKPLHQIIQAKLFRLMVNYVFDNNLGILLCAPVDVYVDEYSVPQPDLLFIRKDNEHIITDDGVMGAPDLVVEIISPSSARRDRKDKLKLYEQRGVPEYWIVEPANATIERYSLRLTSEGTSEGISRFELSAVVLQGETLHSEVIAGLVIPLDAVFR
jgi:Uma2 family endonuclease